MDAFKDGFRRALTIEGRSNRAQYWLFYLINVVIFMALMFAATMMANPDGTATTAGQAVAIVGIIYSIILIIPFLTLSIRRMHDLDKSGWWIFISAVPFIGGIWFFILTVLPGTEGLNNYGEQP